MISKKRMFVTSKWEPGISNPEFFALKSGLRSAISMDQLEAPAVAVLKGIARKNGWALGEKRLKNSSRVILARTTGALKMNRDINSLAAARSFGYPDCCFHAFCELFGENYEKRAGKPAILERLNAPGRKWYLANDFLYSWFRGYSLSFHHPCGYSCKETVKNNMKVLLAIKKEDPAYAHEIVKHLTLPMLAWFAKPDETTPNYQWFRNRTVLVFDGDVKGKRIHYRDVASLATGFRAAAGPGHLKVKPFQAGNICELREKELLVFKDSKHLFSLPRNSGHEGLLLKFT